MRDYLVFVRAGARSLHRQAIEDDFRRNWDCCVSWYSDPLPEESLAERYDHRGANKYEAFAQTFHDARARRHYRYVLLLDDDVKFRPGDISRLFEICDRERGPQRLNRSLMWLFEKHKTRWHRARQRRQHTLLRA